MGLYLPLLALFLLIAGIAHMAMGRKEFNERHEKIVVIGVILLAITIIFTLITVSGLLYTVFSTGDPGSLVGIFYIALIAAVLHLFAF